MYNKLNTVAYFWTTIKYKTKNNQIRDICFLETLFCIQTDVNWNEKLGRSFHFHKDWLKTCQISDFILIFNFRYNFDIYRPTALLNVWKYYDRTLRIRLAVVWMKKTYAWHYVQTISWCHNNYLKRTFFKLSAWLKWIPINYKFSAITGL